MWLDWLKRVIKLPYNMMGSVKMLLKRVRSKIGRLVASASFDDIKKIVRKKYDTGDAHSNNFSENLNLRQVRQLQKQYEAQTKMLVKRNEVIENFKLRTEKLKLSIEKLKERIQRIDVFAQFYRENMPVNRYLRFARVALEHSSELVADCHICHGLEVTPAAAAVAREVGGRVVTDVIEIPSYFDRAVSSTWHTTNMQMLDMAFEGYARRCDGLLTVGWALKKEIESLSDNITVIPNYRYKEELTRSNVLRERCGLKGDDKLVLSISTLASGLGDVLKAVALLPDEVHFASVGRLVPSDYESSIKSLVDSLGIANRVHFFDQVPYEELTSMASSADVGLIIRDPSVLNNKISLPNRVFDYISSGLPFCCPDLPDISKIIRENKIGMILNDISPEGWVEAISDALNQSTELKSNVGKLMGQWTWEGLEEYMFDSLGRPSSIVLYGFNDVRKNNRTMRMARSMSNKGCKVKVFTYGDPNISNPHIPGVDFHVIEESRN